MSVLEAALGAIGALRQANDAKAAAFARAKALDYAATQNRIEGGVESTLSLDQSNRTLASAVVNAAANGGGASGSATDVIGNLSRQAVFNARSIIYRAETAARNRNYEAQVARADGKNAGEAGVNNAVSSVLTTFSKDAQQAMMMGGG